MKTGGKLAIHRSDRPGDFIGIFTMQDKHTGKDRVGTVHEAPTLPQVARPGGRARPLAMWGPRAPPRLLLFPKNSYLFQNWTDIFFMEFLESVYLPYHIPIPFSGFWSLSEGFFYVLFRCNYLNNV